MNFFGQITFFLPSLYYHLKRVNENRNCLIFCYKHTIEYDDKFTLSYSKSDKLVESESKMLSDEENSRPESNDVIIEPIDRSSNRESVQEETTFGVNLKKRISKFSISKILFESKLRYFLLFLFLCYIGANIACIVLKLKANLPIADFIPDQSYLKKHIINHLTLFNIGPIITIAFMKPLKYWEKETFENVMNLLKEIRKIDGMEKNLEINWLDDIYLNIKSKEEFDPDCKPPVKLKCFYETFMQNIQTLDFYRDDVVFTEPDPDNLELFQINGSKVYLQLQNFTGTLGEVDIMHQIPYLAETKYNFSKSDLIVYSPIYVFLEQIDELQPSLASMLLFTVESIVISSFFLYFDLKSVFLLFIIVSSAIIAIISNILFFGLNLNIVILYQILLLPALLSQFSFYLPYSFLFKASQVLKKNKPKFVNSLKDGDNWSSNSTNDAKSIESAKIKNDRSMSASSSVPNSNTSEGKFIVKNLNNKCRANQLKFSYEQNIKHTGGFLVLIVLLGFSFMHYCTTYNFHALFLFLMSFCLNAFLHFFLFYPVLLSLFGTNWLRNSQNLKDLENLIF